ncbi:hypothetical protein MRX96_035973 [Rhipicephalus microplus]
MYEVTRDAKGARRLIAGQEDSNGGEGGNRAETTMEESDGAIVYYLTDIPAPIQKALGYFGSLPVGYSPQWSQAISPTKHGIDRSHCAFSAGTYSTCRGRPLEDVVAVHVAVWHCRGIFDYSQGCGLSPPPSANRHRECVS